MCNIYIISSDESVLQAFKAAIAGRPELSVRAFATVEIFWTKIARLTPAVIVFDLGSPCRFPAGELARMTRDAPGFGVVALSESDDVQQVVDVMKAGALDLIARPFDAETLLTAIDAGLAHLSRRCAHAAPGVEARRIIATLSRREGEIFTHLLDGQANKIVAYELALSVRTIEIYRSNVMTKLGVRSMAEACGIAFHAGVFPKSFRAWESGLELAN